MTKLIVLPLLAAALTGTFCRAEEKPARTEPVAKEQKSGGRLLGEEAIFAAIKDKYFVSWGGKIQGQDNDYAFRFQEGNKVALKYYSVGPGTLEGRFKIDGRSGEISVTFKDLPANPWPKMIVIKDGDETVLLRADGKTHWHVPEDSGEEGEPAKDGFWPFREKRKIP